MTNDELRAAAETLIGGYPDSSSGGTLAERNAYCLAANVLAIHYLSQPQPATDERRLSHVLAKVQPVAAVVEQVNREIAHCRERLMVALEVVDE